MPELPEVQTVVSSLRPRVAGAPVTFVTVLRPDVLRPAGLDLAERLRGRRIADVSRRGKRIILLLDDGNRFYVHLGMTGRLTVEPPDAPLRKHTHLLIGAGPLQVRFCDPRRFGAVCWLGPNADDAADLGPEPLQLRPRQLARRLTGTRRAVKTALLDQRLIVGLGNIYADESLFAARIHPATSAANLSPQQVSRLCRAIKQTLRRAIRHGGSSINDYVDANGSPGSFQNRHRVYQRQGLPCAVCKQPIIRIILGGRSTHFCPNCQQ